MPINVQYLDYEPLGFLSWGLREDGELVEQRAFSADAPSKETYAVYTLENEALRSDFTYPWVIVGAIRPTSAMEVGPTGFCCGDAEIVALARSPLWRDEEKRAGERTAQRYGVPLVEFDRLAAVASEHGSPVAEDDRLPLEQDPPPEGSAPLERIDPPSRPASDDSSPPTSTEAVGADLFPPSSTPPRPQSHSHADLAQGRSIWRSSFERWRRGPSDWLSYCALGAALVALGVGTWLLASAGWPSGSLLFLLPAAVVIALVSGRRLAVAASAAIAGVVAALLYLLVAAGSGETPEEAQVRFALLVVAWFVTATAFTSALAAATSPAHGPGREQLAALVTVVLPVGALATVGLLGVSAGVGALLVAAVQLACLGLWDRTVEREAPGADY